MSSAGVEHICHKGEMVTNLMVLLSKKKKMMLYLVYCIQHPEGTVVLE